MGRRPPPDVRQPAADATPIGMRPERTAVALECSTEALEAQTATMVVLVQTWASWEVQLVEQVTSEADGPAEAADL